MVSSGRADTGTMEGRRVGGLDTSCGVASDVDASTIGTPTCANNLATSVL